MRTAAVTAALYVPLSLILPPPVDAKASGPKRPYVAEIILHATGGPMCINERVVFSPPGTLETIAKFFESHPIVSIHYVIGRDGKIVASIPEDEIAYHAIGHNEKSIGIELINAGDGVDKFSAEQIAALLNLIRGIRHRHKVGYGGLLRHSDVDDSTFTCGAQEVRRKQDPGPAFPWERVRRLIFARSTVKPLGWAQRIPPMRKVHP